jgi:reverse gyrase
MKERGIGRPSTYAKILDIILRRGYVFETKKYKYLYPTKRGIEVYDYLVKKYRDMVSEERTRMLEKYMDMIESGQIDYQSVLRELHEEIEVLEEAS